MKPVLITESGKKELEAQIEKKKNEIEMLRAEKNTAYEVSGDGWHDNPGFNRLIQQEEQAIRDLKILETKISRSVVIADSERCVDSVKIGSIVRAQITNIKDSKVSELTVEIVGSGETDLQNNKISYDSPIGKALTGLSEGNGRSAFIPKGEIKVTVIKLFADWNDVENL